MAEDQELTAAIAAAKEVGTWLMQYYGNVTYDFKASSTVPAAAIVSAVDAEAENKIRTLLMQYDASIGFRGEESDRGPLSGKHWLVDPIDGTGNFVRGLPFCTTMISLIDNGHVVLTVIHAIAQDETYWAAKGESAFKDGKPLHVSERGLDNALVSFDTRFGTVKNEELYIQMQRATKGLFNSINAGYEYAMVASGRLDGRLCYDPYGQDWDYASGALLVKEAGGVVENLATPGSYDYTDHNFVAVNPTLAEELRHAVPDLFTT